MEMTKLERIKAKRGKKRGVLVGEGGGCPRGGGDTPKGTCIMKGEKA